MVRLFRSRRFWFLFILDFLLLVLAYYGAFWFRFAPDIPARELHTFERTVLPIVFFKLAVLLSFRCYQGLRRYFGLDDMINLVKAMAVTSGIIMIFILFTARFEGYARSVYLLDGILSFGLLGGLRTGMRYLLSQPFILSQEGRVNLGSDIGKRTRRVLVVGAGDAGEQILRETRQNRGLNLDVVGFLDDDASKQGCSIHGKSVLGTIGDLPQILDRQPVDEVIIAMPSAPGNVIRRIVRLCEKTDIPFRTLPGVGELIDGQVQVKRVREVAYRDLLRREPVRLEDEKIRSYIKGKRVLVTGAGGSIGSELCRQILRFEPAGLILCDKTENNLFHIDNEMHQASPGTETSSFLVDITNNEHLHQIFRTARPQVVFHAAAFKHVPIVELNPWEAVKNNIIGTWNVLKCSKTAEVKRFVMVSTDKAVRPTNVMGATKRVAELLTMTFDANCPDTEFVTVRFGNVVGSEGSVIPLFKKQIERGGPLTVTHPEITRFFMTIPEASQLILQAGCMGRGGEIFILDMGTPIRIVDMARDLIRLSGLSPDEDIEIEFIGLRPGEKLYEELITEGEGIVRTHHEKIMVLRGNGVDLEALEAGINRLVDAAEAFDARRIREHMRELVPEYRPQNR